MRTPNTFFLPLTLLLAACPPGGTSSSSNPPCPGREAVKNRLQEIDAKGTVATDCLKTSQKLEDEKGGVFEATADKEGKIIARTIKWNGSPAVEACILDAAKKLTLPPLAGPPVSSLWVFYTPGNEPPKPNVDRASPGMNAYADMGEVMQKELEATCYARYMPPEFPTDIEIQFFVAPGGRGVAATVIESNAKDGDFDTCVQQFFLQNNKFPNMGHDGTVMMPPARFHFGSKRTGA